MSTIFSDNHNCNCEEFKEYYAKKLNSLQYDYQSLYEVAEVIPYEEKISGDIYICYLNNCLSNCDVAPYITTNNILDTNLFHGAIHYVIRLKNKDDTLILEYLRMVAYAFKSTHDLVAKAKIPKYERLRSNIKKAYEVYNSMVQNEISLQNVLDILDE
jgi:hypothetical protein